MEITAIFIVLEPGLGVACRYLGRVPPITNIKKVLTFSVSKSTVAQTNFFGILEMKLNLKLNRKNILIKG